MRCIHGLLAFVLVTWASGNAQADKAWYQDLMRRYANGRVDAAEELATAEVLARADANANGWATLCDTVWWSTHHVSRVHPKEAGAALEALAAHAAAQQAEKKDAPLYALAAAWSTMALCRHRVLTGYRKPQPEWGEAAELLLKHAGTKVDLLEMASTSFCEAAACPDADTDALLARSRAALDRALAAEKDAEQDLVLEAGRHADIARMYLARKKKGPAKKCVSAGLAILAPKMAGGRPTKAIGAAFEELALLNHTGKLRIKEAAFRMTERKSPTGGIKIEIPAGARWVFEKSSEGTLLRISQRTERGLPIRSIGVSGWPSNSNLNMPDGNAVPAADTKALAKATGDSMESHFGFEDLERPSKARKPKLHKDFGDVEGIEAEGVHSSGRWARIRVFYFKAKENKRTYRLHWYEYERDPVDDGVFELVVARLRLARSK